MFVCGIKVAVFKLQWICFRVVDVHHDGNSHHLLDETHNQMYCYIIHYSLYKCSTDRTCWFSILLLLWHQGVLIFRKRRYCFIQDLLVSPAVYPLAGFIVDLCHGASFEDLFHLVNSYFLARDICLGIHILKYFGHALFFLHFSRHGVQVCVPYGKHGPDMFVD